MTAVVQPDLGPPAHKYKDNPADDQVSLSLSFSFFFQFFYFIGIPRQHPIPPVLCYQGFPAPGLLSMLEGRKRKKKHPI
jgi:hypothetical protein